LLLAWRWTTCVETCCF